jgi:hypothetical protein
MRHSHFRLPTSLAAFVTIAVVVAGCTSSADYDPKVRRERLLAIYPPGQTMREDVQKKWAPIKPEFTAVRPSDGWESLDEPRVRTRVASSERRTGRAVWRVDCYVGPDGLLGLCYCWFYYNEADRVVDAEWQYHTD